MSIRIMRSPFSTCISLAFCLLYEFWSFPPRNEPFICKDPKISKIYKGDTITFAEVISAVIIGPLITLFLLEFVKKKTDDKFPESWKKLFLDYSLGLLYTATLTEIGKAAVVELRPHFLDTCKPNINCSTGLVTEYQCAGAAPAWLSRDIYKSFPSGHASVSVYSFAFFAIYFRNTNATFYHKMVPNLVQALYFILASVCSVSRITDHRHHWWDVLSGALLGTICAYLTILLLVRKYNKEDRSATKADKD